MNNRADLHLHTSASDGKLTSRQLVDKAVKADLGIIAITDHDTTNGIEEAVSYGSATGIKVIPGIELSSNHYNESIHILGYFRDNSYMEKGFQKILQDLIDYRTKRGQKIVENLDKFFNIKLDYERIMQESKGVIARPHIAKAILESGYEYTWDYIFKNIICENSPAYVPKKNLTISEGINLLRSVNAVIVLAHPVLIKKSLPEELLRFPFDGIEAIYSMNRSEDTAKFMNLAKNYNKLITAGSDFHGISDNDTNHGNVGCVYLSGENLDRFLKTYRI